MDSAHLVRNGRLLGVTMRENSQHIQRLVHYTDLQLDHLDMIKDTFTSMHNFVHQEKALISRAQTEITLLIWNKSFEKVLDGEEKALDTLVKWLDGALSRISELQDYLLALRGNLVDVKRHYKGVELTGHHFRVSLLNDLGRSLAEVNVSLDQIATVLKSA